MALEITKLSSALGAKIKNLDLRQGLGTATLRIIHAALLEHLVLVFSDQDVTVEEQTQFAEYFGEIDKPMVSNAQDEQNPHVMFVSNVRDIGLRTSLEEGEMMFHSDRSFAEFPFKATTLYALEVPPKGGNTLFANCYAAYDKLPDRTKKILENKKALHVYDYDNNQVQKTVNNSPDAPRYVQPIFRTHPETGRKSLYVNRLMTDQIIGLEERQSKELLQELFDFAEQGEFIYEHKWNVGDLIIWDNRCTMHARTHFDPDERRMLRRVTICGDRAF